MANKRNAESLLSLDSDTMDDPRLPQSTGLIEESPASPKTAELVGTAQHVETTPRTEADASNVQTAHTDDASSPSSSETSVSDVS